MPYVVTLLDYVPPARGDHVPFVKARIEEAAVEAGPWSTIDTLTVAPAADPEHPEGYDLTTLYATLVQGFYRVVWIDSNAEASTPSAPVQNLGDQDVGIRPTIADVAALLRARTKIPGGKEAGTFTGQTRPTDSEVDALIDDAVDEVLGKVQPPELWESPGYERRVRGAVRLYTAILIESSYFPEQVRLEHSPVPTYLKLYDSRILALIAEGETGHAQGTGEKDAPADPYYTFPEGGMIGMNTRF